MQPNEDFGSTAIRTFIKVFAGMMGLVVSSLIGLMILGGVSTAFTQEEISDLKTPEYKLVEGENSADLTLVSIPIEGIILGEPSANNMLDYFSEMGITYGYQVKAQLSSLAEDDEIDGVILEVHSPGGTIYGSRAITDGVAAYMQKTGKPVFAYIGSMAASGGFWAAVAADKVIADHGVTLGSIGVIAGPFKYYDTVVSEDGGAFLGGVVTEKGISNRYITAGNSKDFGNPYREMTDGEVAVLQSAVNNAYQDFVGYVAQRRNISAESIITELGAMVYDENQALQFGLIDQIGNKQSAYQALADVIEPNATYMVKQASLPTGFFATLLSSKNLFAQKSVTTICPVASTVLAFHGDLATLCR